VKFLAGKKLQSGIPGVAREDSKIEFDRILRTGTNVMILKIFSPKNLAKTLAFLIGNKGKF
jgi:hypothetical protein